MKSFQLLAHIQQGWAEHKKPHGVCVFIRPTDNCSQQEGKPEEMWGEGLEGTLALAFQFSHGKVISFRA